jgi:hypothetical protein
MSTPVRAINEIAAAHTHELESSMQIAVREARLSTMAQCIALMEAAHIECEPLRSLLQSCLEEEAAALRAKKRATASVKAANVASAGKQKGGKK